MNVGRHEQGRSRKKLLKLSDYYQYMKMKRYTQLVCAQEGSPAAGAAFDAQTLKKHDHGKKRVGRPRLNWVDTSTELFWDKVVSPSLNGEHAHLNLENPAHKEAIRAKAQEAKDDTRVLLMALGY